MRPSSIEIREECLYMCGCNIGEKVRFAWGWLGHRLAAWSPLPARRRYPVLQARSSPNCRIESVWLLVLDLHRSVAAAI
jgi:hypothetical protein